MVSCLETPLRKLQIFNKQIGEDVFLQLLGKNYLLPGFCSCPSHFCFGLTVSSFSSTALAPLARITQLRVEMGAPISRNMCCSIREKVWGKGRSCKLGQYIIYIIFIISKTTTYHTKLHKAIPAARCFCPHS